MKIAKNKSLIFIPDISGFTRFIGQTEIEHSRHIISELLEVLIDANETDLTLAEIEGDAILFYQENSTLTLEQVLAQVKNMFVKFHEHLKLYETRRICECGACTSANELTVKFVVHFAEFGIIEVKHFKKPYGYEVVRAHRLLKNNLDEKEYLLITDSSFDNPADLVFSSQDYPWFEVRKGNIVYETLGETPYKYSLLDGLYDQIKEPPPLPVFDKSDDPIKAEITVESPVEVVFDALSDFEKRQSWQSGIKGILFDPNRINRIGTVHTCLIGSSRLNIETMDPGESESEKSFAERTLNVPLNMVKELTSYYQLSQNGNGTNVKIEIHYHPHPFPRTFLSTLLRKQFEKNLPVFLSDLKSYCEKQ